MYTSPKALPCCLFTASFFDKHSYAYVVETKLYYLQSRYYNPEIGRFINVDALVSTGRGLLGNNMFAYCNNNPVNCADSTGRFPVLGVIAAVVGTIAAIAIDHYVAKRHNGSYQEHYYDYGNGVTEKGNYATGSGFSRENGELTLLDSEIGIYSMTYTEETDTTKTEINFLNFGTAAATASADFSYIPSVSASAVASVLSANIDYTLNTPTFNVNITVAGYLGGAAAEAIFDFDDGKFKLTPPSTGAFITVGFDIDRMP